MHSCFTRIVIYVKHVWVELLYGEISMNSGTDTKDLYPMKLNECKEDVRYDEKCDGSRGILFPGSDAQICGSHASLKFQPTHHPVGTDVSTADDVSLLFLPFLSHFDPSAMLSHIFCCIHSPDTPTHQSPAHN